MKLEMLRNCCLALLIVFMGTAIFVGTANAVIEGGQAGQALVNDIIAEVGDGATAVEVMNQMQAAGYDSFTAIQAAILAGLDPNSVVTAAVSTGYATPADAVNAAVGVVGEGQRASLQASADAAVPGDPEPTNHPTSFSASASSVSQIDTSWTDSTGSILPSGYLVMCSTTNNFTNPVDGIEQSNDTNCANGNGVHNIAQGIQTASWTGLTNGTQYYFKIFPYKGSGSSINYKTNGTPPAATAITNDYVVSIAKTSDGSEPGTDPVFTVSVTPQNASGSAITGNIAYSGSTTNGTDYATGPTSFSIANGSSSTTVPIDVTDDTLVEGTETVTATISSPSTGSIGTNNATANIDDNDGAVTVLIDNAPSSLATPNAFSVTFNFSESVTGFTQGDITVTNGSAGNLSGSGAVYTADITPDHSGNINIDVAANVAFNSVNNGNNAAATVTVNCGVGCNETATVKQTQNVINNLLGRHAVNITSQGPGLSGLMNGNGFGGGINGFMGNAPVDLNFTGDKENNQGNFSLSLNNMLKWSQSLARNANAKPGEEREADGIHNPIQSPVNFWVKGRWTHAEDDRGNIDEESDSDIVSVGAYYRYHKDLIICLMAHIVWFDD